MSDHEPTPTLHPRTGLLLTLAALLAVPVWLIGVRWMQVSLTGWSELAARHPVDGRALDGSVGRVIVSIQHGNGPRHEFRYSRTLHGAFIEAGLTEEGFWLRSTDAAPSPPIYIQWRAVRNCGLLSASLGDSVPDEPVTRVIVQHPDFERACTRAVLALDRGAE